MYNKVIMIGNLTRDIELRYLPSGTAVAKSAIATSHKFKNAQGEQQEEVCFLDFNVFGRGAEILNQYVRKGSKVLLEGRLVLETWVGPDGNNRSKHSLRVENFKFLDTKAEAMAMGNQMGRYNNQPVQNNPYQQQPTYDAYSGMQPASYNQPIQNQNPYTQQNQPPKPQENKMQVIEEVEEKLPEIDINEDEIPF